MAILNNKTLFLGLVLLSLFSCDRKSGVTLLDGTPYVLKENMEGNKLYAFTFLSPKCPLSENYTLCLNELQDEFNEQGVVFYVVFPGTFYSKEKIELFCQRYKVQQTCLLDPAYSLVEEWGATITPEVFLLAPNLEVLYSGAIDNWAVSLGQQRPKATEHYFADAISQALAGKTIEVKNTKAVGCFIER